MTKQGTAGFRQCRALEPVPQLVLFDLDDTLCDYAAARASRLRRAFTLHLGNAAAPLPEGTIREMIAASIAESPHGIDHFPDLFTRFGIDLPGAAEAAATWYRSNRFHDLTLFPEVVATLRDVRDVAMPGGATVRRRLGIITNGPAQVQRDKVVFLAVGTLVDFVVISGEFGVEKPDRRIYLEALRLGGAAAAETVFVGDDPGFDILGANNAGIRSVWVNRIGATWPDQHHGPTREVADLSGLVELLGAANRLSSS